MESIADIDQEWTRLEETAEGQRPPQPPPVSALGEDHGPHQTQGPALNASLDGETRKGPPQTQGPYLDGETVEAGETGAGKSAGDGQPPPETALEFGNGHHQQIYGT